MLTVPVAGNHPDEHCRATTFADSFCDQAWRWNLDYVEDVHGNTTSLWYERETNWYAKNLDQDHLVDYHRAGSLVRIDYGTDKRTLVGGVRHRHPVHRGTGPDAGRFRAGRTAVSPTAATDANWA